MPRSSGRKAWPRSAPTSSFLACWLTLKAIRGERISSGHLYGSRAFDEARVPPPGIKHGDPERPDCKPPSGEPIAYGSPHCAIEGVAFPEWRTPLLYRLGMRQRGRRCPRLLGRCWLGSRARSSSRMVNGSGKEPATSFERGSIGFRYRVATSLGETPSSLNSHNDAPG